MNDALLSSEVRFFLQKQLHEKPAALALRKSPFPDITAAELAGQLDGLQRSAKKLPLWHRTPGIYYPSKLAMEQCSSAETAHYKAGLISKGSRGVDLTGGFGVDTYYFSRVGHEVIHCEINPELSAIVKHNNKALKAGNISCLPVDGIAWLMASDETFDYIYIDPSRRVKQQKVFTLTDVEPNVPDHQQALLQKSPVLIMKAAPLLDISAALKQLSGVAEVHVLSIHNECKELLFIQRRNYTGDVNIHCALLHDGRQRVVSFSPGQEKAAEVVYGPAMTYLYEPDAALLKAGCFKWPATHYEMVKLQQHTHLYTSDVLNKAFPGRSFRITGVQDYGSFKKNKARIKANIAVRNFPLKTDELRKLHPITDGGDVYLFFCTNHLQELQVIFSEKADQPSIH